MDGDELGLENRQRATIGLPLLAMLYIRRKDVPELPKTLRWAFRTKLELAAQLVTWLSGVVSAAGKRLWIVVDGFYAKRPFLKVARKLNLVVISRLRKDATLWSLPPKLASLRRKLYLKAKQELIGLRVP